MSFLIPAKKPKMFAGRRRVVREYTFLTETFLQCLIVIAADANIVVVEVGEGVPGRSGGCGVRGGAEMEIQYSLYWNRFFGPRTNWSKFFVSVFILAGKAGPIGPRTNWS